MPKSGTADRINQHGESTMRPSSRQLAIAALVLLMPSISSGQSTSGSGATRVPLVFSEGHETDPRDRGRPVVLVAGALGVAPEVFREAFSHVRPAKAGTRPDPEQVRKNKSALMQALGKYGVSNDRLDEVSNYYRYVRSRGEMWPTKPAAGYARVKDGKVVGFVITDGGSGYSSPPLVSVSGMSGVAVEAKLSFSQDFAANGTVSAVTLASRTGK
jgi:hypothetical protein